MTEADERVVVSIAIPFTNVPLQHGPLLVGCVAIGVMAVWNERGGKNR